MYHNSNRRDALNYEKNKERLDGVAYRLAEKFVNGDIDLEALINLCISAGGGDLDEHDVELTWTEVKMAMEIQNKEKQVLDIETDWRTLNIVNI